MQLTDEDRAAIEIAGKSAGDIRTHLTEAYRAGMRAGMERAAKACESERVKLYDHAQGPYIKCAAIIRAAKE